MSMNPLERSWRIGRDVAGIGPRSVRAVTGSGDWNPLSLRAVRQLAEVVIDEVTLTGMTLTAPPPKPQRSAEGCRAAAEELAGLGVAGAHTDPEPLRALTTRRKRIGRVVYEQVTFEHDPRLPTSLRAEGLSAPATAVVHLCRAGDEPRPWLVWVHGAGQGQPLDLLFSRAGRIQRELGFNVALPVQPGHGVRRAAWPPYPTMDPVANVAGMMRSVSEVRSLVRWLRPQATAIAVSGVSMGSPVAALVSHLEPVDAVAVYTPILGLNAMIAPHLRRWGPSARDISAVLESDAVAALDSTVDHLSVEPSAPRQHRLVVGAWYDRMARREPALLLHDRWNGELYWHDGGHAGHLFARGVQTATERFLRGVAARTTSGDGKGNV